jgi:hypothetical protein
MTITEAIDFAQIGVAMGEQLQNRKDLPATGNDLIQLADRIDSNFSQVRTFFNRVEYKFIDIDKQFIEIDKRFNILESKIDKLPGRISRQIFAAVASFTGIIAAVVAVTIQVMN